MGLSSFAKSSILKYISTDLAVAPSDMQAAHQLLETSWVELALTVQAVSAPNAHQPPEVFNPARFGGSLRASTRSYIYCRPPTRLFEAKAGVTLFSWIQTSQKLNTLMPMTIFWAPLTAGTLKLNVDGSAIGNPSSDEEEIEDAKNFEGGKEPLPLAKVMKKETLLPTMCDREVFTLPIANLEEKSYSLPVKP
ncbi:hypothetical protein ACH5RR_023179 [Cinchona calisaya]|uniref:Uncharacterized protein n=1 Tax=Cinchona calisaya TaxID=153742 RepID=A0ABD2ZD29_9GENT